MRTCVLSLIAMLGLPLAAVAADPGLRYDWKPGQTFAYQVKVVVDLPTSVETYEGVTSYTVKSAEGDNRVVTYHGGLRKSTKEKAQERPRGFRGPRFRAPGPPPSPFSRNNFRGTDITTSEIVLDALGHVSQMKGDSQLPYLLGNVSLLPFEALPQDAGKAWESKVGTTITETESRTDDFRRFRPLGPFGGGEQPEETQTASEVTSYAITGEDDNLVTISKTYELKSPAPKAGEQGFNLSGKGTWKFDRKEHVPASLEMEQKLVVSTSNQQVTVPITISYHRLSAEELAKVEAERKRLQDELRRRHEAAMAARAEEQRKSEAPLTADEKQAALATLAKGEVADQTETLGQLAKKNPKEPDSEIAGAIEALLKHRERSVREAAHKALLKWSLEYRSRGELDEQYAGLRPVTPTGQAVTATTPLFVGQIVILKDNNRWVPADVLEVLADGRVKVHPRGWNTDAWDKAVARDQLQLAPEALFQPARSPQATAIARTWSDATGTHKIEAEYLGFADGKVRLKKTDGKEINVPLASLSKEDQAHVEQLQRAAAAPPNPFE